MNDKSYLERIRDLDVYPDQIKAAEAIGREADHLRAACAELAEREYEIERTVDAQVAARTHQLEQSASRARTAEREATRAQARAEAFVEAVGLLREVYEATDRPVYEDPEEVEPERVYICSPGGGMFSGFLWVYAGTAHFTEFGEVDIEKIEEMGGYYVDLGPAPTQAEAHRRMGAYAALFGAPGAEGFRL